MVCRGFRTTHYRTIWTASDSDLRRVAFAVHLGTECQRRAHSETIRGTRVRAAQAVGSRTADSEERDRGIAKAAPGPGSLQRNRGYGNSYWKVAGRMRTRSRTQDHQRRRSDPDSSEESTTAGTPCVSQGTEVYD